MSGDRLSYGNTTLSTGLGRAFGLKFGGQVIGPSWVFTERYDITLKAPDNTRQEEMRECCRLC